MLKQIVDVDITRLNPFIVVSESEVRIEGQIQRHHRLPFFVYVEDNNRNITRAARLPNYPNYPLYRPVELVYICELDPEDNVEARIKEQIIVRQLSDNTTVIDIRNPCVIQSIYRQLKLDTKVIYKYVDQFPDPSKPRLIDFRDLRTHQLYTLENTLRVAKILAYQQEVESLRCLRDSAKYLNYSVISLLGFNLREWLTMSYSDYFYVSYTKTSPRINWLTLGYSQYQYLSYNQYLDLDF